MKEVKVRGLTFKDINVSEVSGYSGTDLLFTFQGKRYVFMVANTNPPMPLNILHRFAEQGTCPLCHRIIYPYPTGQQPCLELKKMDYLLLEAFQKHLSRNVIPFKK
ncbi:hypothetical protein [Neobacillus sp. LXY-1]|uniref:hypothetical protein n=1 Tax=Neobacillus sp. LXY-1 TaxID=3379133 RepID=UPI003EE2175B